MKAAVLYKPMDLRIEDFPMPEIGPDDVLIRVKICGICHSDYLYWKYGRIGDYVVKEPLILGHEFSGVIEEVGENVTTLKKGDRVVVEPGVPCRRCHYCKTGRYNLCPHMKFMATPPVHGAFAEYVSSPYDFVFKMPNNMTFEEGALIEPLSVALWSIKRGNITPASSVAILGAGAIGLITLEALKSIGVTRIYVVDRNDWKLNLASKLGATATFNSLKDDVVKSILSVTNGEGVDVAIETTGAEEIVKQTVKIVRNGGVIVLVGFYNKSEISFPLIDVIWKELDIRGQIRYVNMFPIGIELVSKGRVNVKQFITHKLPFNEIEKGFRIMDEKKEKFIKIQVQIS